MNTTITGRLAFIATLALGALGGAVAAQEIPSIPVYGNTVVVRYADLNTGTVEGMAALDRRLDSATVSVCRYYRARLQDPQIENDCRHHAKRNAISQFERNEAQRYDLAMAGRPVETASIRVAAY